MADYYYYYHYCMCPCVLHYSYYTRGDVTPYTGYLNPNLFHSLAETIDLLQSTVAGSLYPQLPIWNGETSDMWHSGTANVSDRFISGFL